MKAGACAPAYAVYTADNLNLWLVSDKNHLVSGDEKYMALSTTTKALNIQGGTMNVSATWLVASQTATYAVPEPTSGLLMILGMCGLALRRRHA